MEGRNITLLYATETGTTEDYAQELGRTLERLHFHVRMMEMDSFEPKLLLQTQLCIFMAPTTGQGDMPENMQKFWKFLLRKRLPVDLLKNMKFTTFGLGDSTYPKYNWAIKKLHKRILQLGGQEFYIRGEGDEQHEEGVDGNLIPWVTGLSTALLELFPLPPNINPIPVDKLLPPKYTVELDHSKEVYPDTSYTDLLYAPRGPASFTVTVDQNTRVTPTNHFQDVRLLSLKLPSPSTHSPGDALSILATNPPEVVEEAIQILNLGIDPDQPLKIIQHSGNPSSLQFVERITLRTLLIHHLDVNSIPRRSFFSFCAAFCNDEFHKERLVDFTDPKYAEELYDYTTRPRRSILEVLQEFGSVNIPLAYLLEVIPKIKARLFSIASAKDQFSSNDNASVDDVTRGGSDNQIVNEEGCRMDLLIAIVKYRTVIKKIRRGICTRYISGLQPGDKLCVSISKGGLGSSTQSVQPHTPVVMVGPGTGLAPMRALIWERLRCLSTTEPSIGGLKPGKNLLFFGCRGREVDYYFSDEWEELGKKYGPEIFEIKTAFSRDQQEKRYVQHLIKECKGEVWRLIYELRGVVYVCGSSGRMPQAIREALIEVFTDVGSWEREKAEAYLLEMEGSGRYRQETW